MTFGREIRHVARTVVGVCAAIVLSGVIAALARAQGPAAVQMTGPTSGPYAFTPSSISVPVGTTLTWTNASDAPHTVTSDTGAFGSGNVTQSQTFAFTFKQAGTFNYHCAIHPYMQAVVTVTAAATATTAAPAPAPTTAPTVAPQSTAAAPAAQAPAHLPSTGAGGGAPPVGTAIALCLLAVLVGLVAYRHTRRI